MKLKIRIVLGIMISMLMQISVFANSMPMIMEEDPAFSIAPMGSTPIEVTSEYLEFDMREGQGSTAKVTASYEMKNTSQEVIEQSMLFPFITANRKGFLSKVEITADNQPVTFKTFRLEDLPNMNYGGSTQDYFDGELSPIVTIDNIVEMLNDREYTPKHYHLDEIINVYNLHWSPKEEDYRGEVAYKIDPQKHRLLFYNYNAFSFNQDGAGTLGTWVPSKEIRGEGHKTYMVILGEAIENQGIFEISGEPEFIVEEKTFGEFLREDLIQSRLKEDPLGDQEELYNYSIKQLDRTLGGSQLLIPLDEDILAPFFYDTYIGALLYQVEFPPEGKINVTVVYEMEATRDRRETRDFTDTFLYLLRPAAGWKDFGNLTIKVIPNESKPFVIESSLPLIKDEITGIYYGEFEGLPETDLYFTTYKTDKPDPPLPKVIRNGGYLLFFLAPMLVIIMILGGIAAILLALKKKRNY